MYLNDVGELRCSARVHKLAKSLSTKFQITKDRDLAKAIELACCLQVLGDRAVFLRYIESFIYDIEYGKSGYAWGHKCDGLALLAYDSDAHGDVKRRQVALGSIASRNFDEGDLDWLVENAKLELEADAVEREGERALAQAGTPLHLTLSERQQGHYSRLVIFSYYHQLLKAYKSSTEGERIARFLDLAERERRGLAALVQENACPR